MSDHLAEIEQLAQHSHDPVLAIQVRLLVADIRRLRAGRDQLRDELEQFGHFVPGECPQGKHLPYAFDDGDGGVYGCPGCAIDALRAELATALRHDPILAGEAQPEPDGTVTLLAEHEDGPLSATPPTEAQ